MDVSKLNNLKRNLLLALYTVGSASGPRNVMSDQGDEAGLSNWGYEGGHVAPVTVNLNEGRSVLPDKEFQSKEVFYIAAMKGLVNVLEEMMDRGMSPDTIIKSGNTALQIACAENRLGAVNLLLSKGANPNLGGVDTGYEHTPLVLASMRGNNDIVKALLKNGALVDKPNFEGVTPFIVAAQFGNVKVVKTLLRAGADVEVRDNFGVSAMDVAEPSGDTRKIIKNHIKKVKNKAERSSARVESGQVDEDNDYLEADPEHKNDEGVSIKDYFVASVLAVVTAIGNYNIIKEVKKPSGRPRGEFHEPLNDPKYEQLSL